MQELIDTLKACGFEPPTLQLDGSLVRFGRNGGKDNAWLIGWRNHSIKTGKPYFVMQFGDWKTGEVHTHKPSGSISREDGEAIKRQLAMARAKFDEDKKERQAAAAVKSDAVWKASQDVFESKYYKDKLIDKPYGTRTFVGEGGRVIVVPLRDAEGNTWNLQRIFADGSKKFQFGGRVDGLFHLIGPAVTEQLLIAEGFATAASLHQATGLTVAAAFNAGNIVSVAKALRKAYPDVAMTICGDDDKWKPEAGNAGREKATKAGMLAQAGTVFPTFANDEPDENGKRPTDFNDLHYREGLDAVKAFFVQPAVREDGFIPLGVSGTTDFFYSVNVKDVLALPAYTETLMMKLAPLEYWAELYPSKTGIDWQAARNKLIQACQAMGPFDTGRIRGTGVWMDDGRVVVNTGQTLLVNGKPLPLQAVRSWYVYIATKKRMPPVRTDALTVAECGLLVAACDALKWRERQSAIFLAGWLAIARVAGALPIRPHIWLTGSSATGKSTVLDRIIAPALGGPAGRLYAQGGTTEAGIRQELASSSVPVLFDEFETTGQASSDRVASLVELLRQTWSATQGSILKGSATGGAVHYQLSFAALVSSIRVNLSNDADRSRFTLLELAPHGSDSKQWGELDALLRGLTEEYGERLFARSCSMLDTIIASQRVFAEALVKAGGTGQRMAQQFGTLLAGYWSLQSDDVVSAEVAANVVRALDLAEAKESSKLTDELECLNHLLTSRISVVVVDLQGHRSNEQKTIGKILTEGVAPELKQLETYGVMLEKDGIVIANTHAELGKLFANTHWRMNWTGTMSRIQGSKPDGRHKFGAQRSRSWLIPFSAVPSLCTDPADSLP